MNPKISELLDRIRQIEEEMEQYWCPIKHARHLPLAHPYYRGVADFGYAEGYRRELQAPRTELARLDAAERK